MVKWLGIRLDIIEQMWYNGSQDQEQVMVVYYKAAKLSRKVHVVVEHNGMHWLLCGIGRWVAKPSRKRVSLVLGDNILCQQCANIVKKAKVAEDRQPKPKPPVRKHLVGVVESLSQPKYPPRQVWTGPWPKRGR